jgi:hypothetical protein
LIQVQSQQEYAGRAIKQKQTIKKAVNAARTVGHKPRE